MTPSGAQHFATTARSYCRAITDGIVITVRVTPRGGRDAIGGERQLPGGQVALEVRVRAAASDGAANEAVLSLVARAMGVARRDIALSGGHSARLKALSVQGDPQTLLARAILLAEHAGS